MEGQEEQTTSTHLTKRKVLCTVTFLYTMKGVVNARQPKSDTVFAYIEEGATNKDCVAVFAPKGVKKELCIIHEVIVLPVQTVFAGEVEEAEEKKLLHRTHRSKL